MANLNDPTSHDAPRLDANTVEPQQPRHVVVTTTTTTVEEIDEPLAQASADPTPSVAGTVPPIEPPPAPPAPAYEPPAKKPSKVRSLIITLILLSLIGLVLWGLFKDKAEITTEPTTLQGRIEVGQTPVAAKVAGRISQIYVKEGDNITIGTPLIDMESPEINAKLEEARAARDAAQSQLDKAKNGARPQEIEMARYQYEAAQSAADLAKTTFERVDRLASEGLMSRQKRDEAYTNYRASQDKANAAKAQYDLAKTGARSEDIEGAAAQVRQVEGKIKEALVAKDEANLKSPIAGIVDDVIAKPGQVVGQGVPLVTVVDPTDQWVVLNVTENNLGRFAVGSQFTGKVPALSTDGQPYTQVFKVYSSSVLSDFATWRPTNSKDGFDMRTFEIRAHPQKPDSRLRQGMTVLVEIPADNNQTAAK